MGYLIEIKGFTLIEVLTSIAILSIGLLGLASMTTTVISGNTYSENLTSALILAEDKIEELMHYSSGSDDIWGTPDDFTHNQILVDNNLVNWVDADNDGIPELDTDGDGIPDFYDEDSSPDHTNVDGTNGIANPIDPGGTLLGIFNRIWNIADIDSDGDGNIDTKHVAVIVYWTDSYNKHSLLLTSNIR